jgi:hypothetical protein
VFSLYLPLCYQGLRYITFLTIFNGAKTSKIIKKMVLFQYKFGQVTRSVGNFDNLIMIRVSTARRWCGHTTGTEDKARVGETPIARDSEEAGQITGATVGESDLPL